MNVRAILVAGASEHDTAQLADIPLAFFDVLGQSPLVRTLNRLESFGIVSKTVVVGRGLPPLSLPPNTRVVTADRKQLWETAGRLSSEFAAEGDGIVLALGLGPYNEIDYDDLLRFHLRQRQPVTAVVDRNGDCAMNFVCSASRQMELTYLFRHRLKTIRGPHSVYRFSGYSNPLLEIADLRRLAIDAFCGNAELAPDAEEVKPGIWISSTASVHPSARILAPAYIGRHTRVRPSAVVTRCSTVEHHSEIGAGAVVENATILPNALIGPALDISHAVVGMKRLCHLGRSVEIEITDKEFIGQVSTAPYRLIGELASLAVYLPTQFLRGLVHRSGNGKKTQEKAAQASHPVLAPADEEQFPANLAGVRRYGDQ